MCEKRERISSEQVEHHKNKVVHVAFANEVYEQVPIVCPMYPFYSAVAEHIRDTFWILGTLNGLQIARTLVRTMICWIYRTTSHRNIAFIVATL